MTIRCLGTARSFKYPPSCGAILTPDIGNGMCRMLPNRAPPIPFVPNLFTDFRSALVYASTLPLASIADSTRKHLN